MSIVSSPLSVINDLFQRASCPTKPSSRFDVASHFASELCKEGYDHQIPLLGPHNVQSIPNSSLVRLRGFIQDLPNPELYLGVAKLSDGSLVTTKFSDGVDSRLSSAEQVALWDRKPVVVVPAPCSPWVDSSHHAESHATLAPALEASNETLVYMYDEQGSDLALHDLIEVIGVLSRDEEGGVTGDATNSTDVGMEDDQDPFNELKAFSKMVRVHAIITKVQPSPVAAVPPLQKERIQELRASAIQLIGGALGGDLVAAEYLLMLSVEKVTARAAGSIPMGVAPIGLTKCPAVPATTPPGVQPASSPFAEALHLALSSILPLTARMSLSIPALNQSRWAPRREPGGARVAQSPLQLPQGTLLIVDETVLQEGQLTEVGTGSLGALQKVLLEQVLEYEFELFKHPVPVSLPTLVLSTGRSILKEALPVQVPLNAVKEFLSLEQTREGLAEAERNGQLSQIRSYLEAVARIPYELSEASRGKLVDEFVQIRQCDTSFTAEDFQVRLTLARACALSFGEAELLPASWEHLKALEAKRQARLRVV